ncbi:MAG TPA: hypothetical protein VKH41_16455 [Myxococcota bacterium]|nr:hypothetical protein [Myxococcota bacterium]
MRVLRDQIEDRLAAFRSIRQHPAAHVLRHFREPRTDRSGVESRSHHGGSHAPT